MNENAPEIKSMWEQVRLAKSYDELMHWLIAIQDDPKLVAQDKGELILTVFSQLRIACNGDLGRTLPVLLEHLLPFCLRLDEGEFVGEAFERAQFLSIIRNARTLLGDWVEEFWGETQKDLLKGLMQHLHVALHEEKIVATCRVLSSVGYRDDAIVDALFRLAAQNEALIVDCLNTLTDLGMTDSRQIELIKTVVESDDFIRAGYALSKSDLRNPLCLASMVRFTERLSSSVIKSHDLHWSLAACGRAVAFHSEWFPLQDWYWDIVKKHHNIVLMDHKLTRSINSRRIIPAILQMLPKLTSIKDEHMRVLRAFNCIEECSQRKQLDGWNDVNVGIDFTEVRSVALKPTGAEGRATSIQGSGKLAAWKILLCAGVIDLDRDYQSTLSAERNRYIQRDITNLVSCFKLERLPEVIKERITKEYDCAAGDSPALIQWSGDVALARSIGTFEAFEALLGFGFTYDGKVLRNIGDALADVAITLAKAGDDRVVSTLISSITSKCDIRKREIACRALAGLGHLGLIPNSYFSDILRYVSDEELPPYARADLIASLLGTRKECYEIYGNVIHEIALTTSEESIAYAAWLWLVRQGNTDFPATSKSDGWSTLIALELFLKDPMRFSDVIVYIIDNCNDDTIYRISHGIQKATTVPANVADALLRRILRFLSPLGSHGYLFEALAHADFHRLVEEEVIKASERWTIESKVAYARTLGKVVTDDPGFNARRWSFLVALTGDGAMSVRQVANNSLKNCDNKAFVQLCIGRSQATSMQLRDRAAECAEFLYGDPEFDDSLEVLARDRYRKVRNSVMQGIERAMVRNQESHCLEKVLSARFGDNADIFAVFAHGEALKKCGSVESLEALAAKVGDKVPLHVRTWWEHIYDAIEKRHEHRETEIGYGWNAIVEHFSGTLKTPKTEIAAKLHLWKLPGKEYGELGSWGGTAEIESDSDIFSIIMQLFESEYVRVCADGRNQARALVTRTKNDGVVIIKGSGDYPSILIES